MKNFLSMMLMLMMIVACSKDEPKSIILEKETSTEQTIYADETSSGKGISFIASEPWRAEVNEISTKRTAGRVDWIELSQYEGGAGSFTLNLNVQPNTTGADRKAEIVITCGATQIKILIEQKGEKEDGEKLKRVKSINYIFEYGSEYVSHGFENDKCNFNYSYDEKGRVATVTEEWNDSYKDNHDYRFNYHIAGEVVVTDEAAEYDRDPDPVLLNLNSKGKVARISLPDIFREDLVEYTEDGRLAKLYEDEGWYRKLFYTNGLLIKSETPDFGGWEGTTTIDEFSVDKTYPNLYPANRANIDFNGFLYEAGNRDDGVEGNVEHIENILFQIGLLGKGSDCLMETIFNIDHYETPVEDSFYDYEPGKVYKKTRREIKGSKEKMFPVKYEFDIDKYVTKFSYVEPYEVYEYYYEIHVGHELENPNYPEYGYKYEIKNEKWTKLSDEKNTCTYTVTY